MIEFIVLSVYTIYKNLNNEKIFNVNNFTSPILLFNLIAAFVITVFILMSILNLVLGLSIFASYLIYKGVTSL